MIRKINFTGRKKIPRSRVSIQLLPSENGSRRFDADIDFDGTGLPDGAHVYVEAYHRASYMRFDFGRIGAIEKPKDRELVDIDNTARPLFRVKVVDKTQAFGRILAVADKLAPVDLTDADASKQSLLHVDFLNLRDRIWRLDLDDCDWPTLELNQSIEDIREIARSDSLFSSLVYPEIFQRILDRIVIIDDHADPDCNDDDWPTLWLRFACQLPGVNRPPAGIDDRVKQEKQEWVKDTVAAFCRSAKCLNRFLNVRAAEGEP